MTPQDLIAAFQTLAEAPDGIARLRELVLQLAVRGKLVPQDPDDEPASVLLERIAEEKALLVNEGEIRTQKPLPPVSDDEIRFELPNGWSWARLGACSHVEMGQSPASKYYNQAGQGMPFFQGKADFGHRHPSARYWCVKPTKIAEAGDVLLSVRAPVGPTNVADQKCCIGRGLAGIRPVAGMPTDFLLWALRTFERELDGLGTGTTFKAISKRNVEPFVIPIPPLAEQNRIVARVDELMGLLDRLEAARNTRDGTRAALRDSALASLRDADTPEEVEVAWSRVAERMDDLFTTPADVDPLRQTVLQMAVRGRLVPQDPDDEPASALLNGRTFKFSASVPMLPKGWSWSAIRLLGEIRGGATPSKRNADFWGGSVPWVSPKDMKVEYLGKSQDYITEAAVEGSSVKRIPVGSLLMVVRGMILIHSFPVALTTAEVTINQDMKALLPFDGRLAPYLLLMMKGLKQEVLNLVKRSTHGTCKLLTAELFTLPLPVPPLAEQHRIVTKVDELMSLLDRLEQRLAGKTTTHDAFAAAAVHHLDA